MPPCTGPVGNSALFGRGPDRQVRVRLNLERPNQIGATCVKLVANRRRDGMDDVPQMVVSCDSGFALSIDQAAAVHPHKRAAIALVRWDRLLVLGLLVMLGGLLVPPTPLSGGSGTSGATVHEVHALRVHLVLLAGNTLSAGASTSGYVVINNTAKAPISVTQGCGGKPDVAVVLSSPKVPQTAAFAAVRCPDVELTPGLHRYPIDIRASYQGCLGPGGSGAGLPSCLPAPDGGLPPLPVGRYQAVMATDSSIPTAKPLPVTVIRPRADPTAYRTARLATMLTVPALRSLEKRAAEEARLNGDASVHRGYIMLTTREQAAAPDIVNGDQPVYEVVIQGRFTCGGCSIPPGAKIPTGSVITSSVDRQTLQALDFGITRSLPTVLVGEPVYRFRF
jgi:hypothetical protein